MVLNTKYSIIKLLFIFFETFLTYGLSY